MLAFSLISPLAGHHQSVSLWVPTGKLVANCGAFRRASRRGLQRLRQLTGGATARVGRAKALMELPSPPLPGLPSGKLGKSQFQINTPRRRNQNAWKTDGFDTVLRPFCLSNGFARRDSG